MTRDDLYVADEAFFTGSAAEITTIRTVDGRSLENQNSESIVEKIRLYYKDLISNNIDDCPKNWLSLCK
jgi:branched-chain amino acid aminotransferase